MENEFNINPNWSICSVWFVNSNSQKKIFQDSLAKCELYVYDYIDIVLKYKPYYTRAWFDDKNRLWNDYGSYINFIVFVEGDSDIWEVDNCNGCIV